MRTKLEKNKKTSNFGMGDVLFSKTQRRLLGLLFFHFDRSYYEKEIVRFARVGIGSVHRELEKLTEAGLITMTRVGNQKHYRANVRSPIFGELRSIVVKTFAVAEILKKALSGLEERIVVAFVYGSVAKGKDTASSDIDLMVIARDLSYADLVGMLAPTEESIGRPVNPTIYNPVEFQRKLSSDNSFLHRITAQPKIFLIGSDDDLPEPGTADQDR